MTTRAASTPVRTDAGAAVDAHDAVGQTALSYASGSGHAEAVEMLVLAGADVREAVKAGEVMVEPVPATKRKKKPKAKKTKRKGSAAKRTSH